MYPLGDEPTYIFMGMERHPSVQNKLLYLLHFFLRLIQISFFIYFLPYCVIFLSYWMPFWYAEYLEPEDEGATATLLLA